MNKCAQCTLFYHSLSSPFFSFLLLSVLLSLRLISLHHQYDNNRYYIVPDSLGNYSGFLEKKQKRFEDEKKQDDKLKKTLATELEWVRSNPKARQTKSKARLDRYEEMFTTPVREENLGFQGSIYIPPGPRLGDVIIEAKGVCKAYGDKQLMKDVDFSIPQGTYSTVQYVQCSAYTAYSAVHTVQYVQYSVYSTVRTVQHRTASPRSSDRHIALLSRTLLHQCFIF